MTEAVEQWAPTFSSWRHGGWYVDNVRYPSGAIGCVSNNYADKKWRIVCDPDETTFPSRDAAARAERVLAEAETRWVRRAMTGQRVTARREHGAEWDATTTFESLPERSRLRIAAGIIETGDHFDHGSEFGPADARIFLTFGVPA